MRSRPDRSPGHVTEPGTQVGPARPQASGVVVRTRHQPVAPDGGERVDDERLRGSDLVDLGAGPGSRLTIGGVGGVVFAASSADEDIGYAIAADEVDEVLQRALGRTSEVGTGPCIG